MNIIKKLLTSLIISGAVILFIGLYYAVIKAGIPYQDPPLELQIQYAVNMEIGDILTKTGFIMALAAGILRIVVGVVSIKLSKKK